MNPRAFASLVLALGLAACEAPKTSRIAGGGAAISCTPARSSEPIPLLRAASTSTVSTTFDALKARIDERCTPCHRLRRTGGFQYSDSYATDQPDLPGLSQAAEHMLMMIRSGAMPPSDPIPEQTRLLGLTLEASILAGKPDGAFEAPTADNGPMVAGAFPRLGHDAAEAMTNLGSCLPNPAALAPLLAPPVDKDALFAAATQLPADLLDTDLTSFDAGALAKDGVFAFAPAYPLWSDDARKLRMVRVPRGQQISYDPVTRHFHIPPNTRFYKTFFKKVVEPDGHDGSRAIETRLIVSRPAVNGVEQAIFGTYLWDETQSKATLWTGAYRDGTPFRDALLTYTDAFQNCQLDANGKVLTHPDGSPSCDARQRKYAVPAKHRCVQCHEGAEAQNFVLGFTPLQLNRRPLGDGGVSLWVGDDELTQVARLVDYGVLAPIAAESLPKLENSAGDRLPRNDSELRAQAYTVGNCGHCHNPNGFPTRDDARLKDFNLSPGGIVFQFPLKKTPVSTTLAYYVDPNNLNLAAAGASLIYRRVATPLTSVWADAHDSVHLVVQHMPANTPGMDCRAAELIGRWIASVPVDQRGDPLAADASDAQIQTVNSAASARLGAFVSGCVAPDDVANWVTEDLTEPSVYTPRRPDWNTWDHADDGVDPFVHPNQIRGMPQVFRELAIDEQMATVSSTPVPYGFWSWKASCQYPATLPPAPAGSSDPSYYSRPWMMTPQGQPRRPLGEVFFETPGAGIFRAVCSNCHGAQANGNSGNAKALLQLSGGAIRVANLMQGIFGPQNDPTRPVGTNLSLFDQPGTNGASIGPFGAAKYLVWMTSGGTTVKFPQGFESLLGSGDHSFGGNMLTKVSYYCSRLLPTQFWIGALTGDEFETGIPVEKRELWNLFCSYRNQPIPDANNIPPDFDAGRWLRTAQFNGGLMMYFFFRDRASHGVFPPNADQCELSTPRSL